MRSLLLFTIVLLTGCNRGIDTSLTTPEKSLSEARKGFTTKIISDGEDYGPPESPVGDEFELIHYKAPVGDLAAYVTADLGDGMKRPAIIWITGGDNNTIGDVWSPQPASNDQSASPFRKAGMVMMFPSQRGGNDNPGQREGFYGEVDDILAATDHLARLPYVDPEQIYLGGHSTGGTMAMLVGACSDRYRGILALGPVAAVSQYGGMFVYCDPDDEEEMRLRSPIYWMHSVKTPMYVLEGADQGNWDGSIEVMAENNENLKIKFFPVRGHNHFSVIAPAAALFGDQIRAGKFEVTEEMVNDLQNYTGQSSKSRFD